MSCVSGNAYISGYTKVLGDASILGNSQIDGFALVLGNALIKVSSRVTDNASITGQPDSMDGKGAWTDNIFIERFWRSLKYEEVYLRAYDTEAYAKRWIYRYIEYNTIRPHSSLGGKTPDKIHAIAPAEVLLKAS